MSARRKAAEPRPGTTSVVNRLTRISPGPLGGGLLVRLGIAKRRARDPKLFDLCRELGDPESEPTDGLHSMESAAAFDREQRADPFFRDGTRSPTMQNLTLAAQAGSLYHRLPELETLRALRPSELGRLLLPLIALREAGKPSGLAPREFANEIVRERYEHGTDAREAARLLTEGIAYLIRTGALIENPEQLGFPVYLLSRDGAAAVSDPASLSVVHGEAIRLLHPHVVRDALGEFERGPAQYDVAVANAFRTVERAVGAAAGSEKRGRELFDSVMGILEAGGRGALTPRDLGAREAVAVRDLFAGADVCFRGEIGVGRTAKGDPERTMRLLVAASALLDLVEALGGTRSESGPSALAAGEAPRAALPAAERRTTENEPVPTRALPVPENGVARGRYLAAGCAPAGRNASPA